MFAHLTRRLEPLVLPHVEQHPHFGADPLIAACGIRSIFGLPLELRGRIVGLLYLENRQVHTTLPAPQRATLGLIGLQFAIAYENAQIARNLELLVAARTEALERSRGVLQSVLDHAPAAIYLRDLDGRILQHNPSAAQLLGRPGQTLAGMSADDVLGAERAARERRQDELVIEENRAFAVEHDHDGVDGPRTAMLHKFPLRDAYGRPAAVCTIGLDITDLKRAQRAAETATRAKGEFLANMSHEIRTPMNAILGLTYLALQSGLNPRQHDYVKKVRRSAESLLGIIDDILDFSKIEAGRLEMEAIEFDLTEVLDNLASLIGLKAEEKNLEFAYDLAPELPTLLIGDPARLNQVLLNWPPTRSSSPSAAR